MCTEGIAELDGDAAGRLTHEQAFPRPQTGCRRAVSEVVPSAGSETASARVTLPGAYAIRRGRTETYSATLQRR